MKAIGAPRSAKYKPAQTSVSCDRYAPTSSPGPDRPITGSKDDSSSSLATDSKIKPANWNPGSCSRGTRSSASAGGNAAPSAAGEPGSTWYRAAQ